MNDQHRFVWLKGTTGNIYPQIWKDDSCDKVGGFTVYPLAEHIMTEEDHYLTLNELISKYPMPEVDGYVKRKFVPSSVIPES